MPPAIGILLRATPAPKLAALRAWGHGERGGRFPCVMGGFESAALILQSPPATAGKQKSAPGRASVGALVGGTTGSAGPWISAGW